MEFKTTTEAYLKLSRKVREQGLLEAKTREILNVNFVLADPSQNLLLLRKNWKWAFQEVFDRMSSVLGYDAYNPGLAWKYRTNWNKKLQKEGGTFDYSYGEHYCHQVGAAIKLLKKQKTHREAIITVWNKQYLLDMSQYQRRPCTLQLHFLIRSKKLHCFVYMRTNDLVNLLPYDIFHHSFVQFFIADALGLEVGKYHHTVSHLYYPKRRELPPRNYWENIEEKLGPKINQVYTPFSYAGVGKHLEFIYEEAYHRDAIPAKIYQAIPPGIVKYMYGHIHSLVSGPETF